DRAGHSRWRRGRVAPAVEGTGQAAARRRHERAAGWPPGQRPGCPAAGERILPRGRVLPAGGPRPRPRSRAAGPRVRESFAPAAVLLDHPAEQVAIPFEGRVLPGYLFRPDDSGEPRPTVIYHGGYDSVLEEAYFAAAAGAVRRGYNCLAFDGP